MLLVTPPVGFLLFRRLRCPATYALYPMLIKPAMVRSFRAIIYAAQAYTVPRRPRSPELAIHTRALCLSVVPCFAFCPALSCPAARESLSSRQSIWTVSLSLLLPAATALLLPIAVWRRRRPSPGSSLRQMSGCATDRSHWGQPGSNGPRRQRPTAWNGRLIRISFCLAIVVRASRSGFA